MRDFFLEGFDRFQRAGLAFVLFRVVLWIVFFVGQ